MNYQFYASNFDNELYTIIAKEDWTINGMFSVKKSMGYNLDAINTFLPIQMLSYCFRLIFLLSILFSHESTYQENIENFMVN